jgi:O-antigen/teichoic acid export membrane protein
MGFAFSRPRRDGLLSPGIDSHEPGADANQPAAPGHLPRAFTPGGARGVAADATVFLIILGKPLIAWLYTPQFLPAYPALLILLLGYLAANTFYWRRSALLALGRADFPAKVNLVLAAFKMAGILLLVPRYGYLASAALLTGFYWIGSLVTVWKVYTLLPKESRAA